MKKNSQVFWVLAGLAAAAVVLLAERVYAQPDLKGVLAAVSDAFFVPGMLFFSLGLLHFVTNGSMFDMLTFGGQSLLGLFAANKSEDPDAKRMKEFRARQRKENPVRPVICLTGLAFLAVSALTLWIRG